jgi:hypothetical protein
MRAKSNRFLIWSQSPGSSRTAAGRVDAAQKLWHGVAHVPFVPKLWHRRGLKTVREFVAGGGVPHP